MQGRGIGAGLLALAERRAQLAGFSSVYLFTHEGMSENLAMYSRAGYVEYDRRSEGHFQRVFLRKSLAD